MNRIKELRKEKNLTQADLAKLLDVSDRSIGFYENEKRDPDTKALKKLADYFSVTIDYLLGRTDTRQEVEAVYSSGFSNLSTEGLSEDDIEIIKSMIERLKNTNN